MNNEVRFGAGLVWHAWFGGEIELGRARVWSSRWAGSLGRSSVCRCRIGWGWRGCCWGCVCCCRHAPHQRPARTTHTHTHAAHLDIVCLCLILSCLVSIPLSLVCCLSCLISCPSCVSCPLSVLSCSCLSSVYPSVRLSLSVSLFFFLFSFCFFGVFVLFVALFKKIALNFQI